MSASIISQDSASIETNVEENTIMKTVKTKVITEHKIVSKGTQKNAKTLQKLESANMEENTFSNTEQHKKHFQKNHEDRWNL